MTHFEPDQAACRQLRERLRDGDIARLRDNTAVLEALGFPLLRQSNGQNRWKREPGACWSARPSPLWSANDAFYVAKCLGMGLHSVERVSLRALGDSQLKRDYLVRVGYEANPLAGAAAGQALDFAVAFTIAILNMAGR